MVACREDGSWSDMARAAGDGEDFAPEQSPGSAWSGSTQERGDYGQPQEPIQAQRHRLPQWNQYDAAGSAEPVRGDASTRRRRGAGRAAVGERAASADADRFAGLSGFNPLLLLNIPRCQVFSSGLGVSSPQAGWRPA